MCAHEFITEDQKRRPQISLRHLNHLKHINRARAASHARQAALKRIMYANPAREHERIELEKARLELEELRAEIAKTHAETEETKADTPSPQPHRLNSNNRSGQFDLLSTVRPKPAR